MSEEKKHYMYEMWIEDNKIFQRQPEGVVCVNDLTPDPGYEKIKENQKIVDAIIKLCNEPVKPSLSDPRRISLQDALHLTLPPFIREITGKDINDL